MPRRDGPTRPSDAVPHGDWPYGDDAADPAARYVQYAARELHKLLNHPDVTLREVARLAALSPMTIAALRDGLRYPDLRTIARLETEFKVPMLPAFRKRVPDSSEDEDDI